MEQPASIRGVFFDMDGVLVDVSRSYRRAIQETAEHFVGRRITNYVVQRYKNAGGFNDDWKLTHAIVTDAGMEVPYPRVVEQFQQLYRGDNWNGLIAEEPPLIASHTLDALSTEGRVLGVVTGRPDAEARWTIDRFGWGRYFPLVVARERHEGRGKPDPFPLQRALAILDAAGLQVAPEECVYIGDSVDDMVAARAAGMWAIGFVPPYLDTEEHSALLRKKGAHLIVTDATVLVRVIDHLTDHLGQE